VIKQSAFGDFVLALGAMEAIRRHHPKAHITCMTTHSFVDLAHRSGYFDRVEEAPRLKWYDFSGWWRRRKRFIYGGFDRVYDLQMNAQTARYYHLIPKSIRPDWSGVVRGSDLFFDDPNWRSLHAFERHRDILNLAGIEKVPYPDLGWMTSDISHLNAVDPFILLVPGSAPMHLEKRWPAMKYAGLAKYLIRDGYNVVVLGTQAESDVTTIIKKACPEVIDLSEKTGFFDIVTLAQRACFAIGNDTGPLHLIAMAGCPSLALFSSASDPEQSAPRGKSVTVLQSEDLNDLNVMDVKKHVKPDQKKSVEYGP
jgi:ADP-heptose:LPS heptosyltransferase